MKIDAHKYVMKFLIPGVKEPHQSGMERNMISEKA